jgi:hypothetical protein
LAKNKIIKNWISSTFGVSNQKLVNRPLNSELLTAINRDSINFNRNVSLYVSLLQSQKLCRYQSKLLKEYFANPAEHLRLDCDRLIFTIDCSANDVNNIIKLIGKKQISRICKISDPSLSDLFSIKRARAANINRDWKANKDIKQVRPYYSHEFVFQIKSNKRAWLRLYVANGAKNNNGKTSIRIDFIPDRLEDKEIVAIFGHICSRLGVYRYHQLFSRAKIKRIDYGFILSGVLSIFFYSYKDIVKKLKSICWPTENDRVKETTYLGKKDYSSHIVIYEKLLKEAKDHPEILSMLDLLAVTTRCEFKFLADKDNKRLNLMTMTDAPIRLDELKVFDPRNFYLLSEQTLENMLLNKTQHNVKKLRKTVGKQLKSSDKNLKYFRIDKQWLNESKEELMNHYCDLILHYGERA